MHTRLRDDWLLLAFVAATHVTVFIVATCIWVTPPAMLLNSALQISLLSSSADRAVASPPSRRMQPLHTTVPAKTSISQPASEPVLATQSQSATADTIADSSTESTQASFDAAYLQNPKPPYPSMARRLGEHGRVLLRVQVTAEGSAAHVAVQISSGSLRLDQAALETVRKWRFVTARQRGRPVVATIVVPIVFNLEG